jgi:plastocyanin
VAPSVAGGSTGNAVTIADFSFTPDALTAKVGQEITWTNTGNLTHTVTFDKGGVNSGNIGGGGTFTHTFTAAGSFTYHCSIHAAMQATVTVQ